MNSKSLSKFLSLVLRHKPEEIGLELDSQGWASTQELISKMQERGFHIDLALLREVVTKNDKQRFKLSEDLSSIRANQGHSIDIELGLSPKTPPEVLFHGTAKRNVSSILDKGLLKGARQHVHLSSDTETAIRVGSRHGKSIVFQVDTKRMHLEGYLFFQSENEVWLTDYVAPKYLKLLD